MLPIAWGWANLPMLGWLAAVAVPIAIHLWSRRRFREVPWAAMEYLLAAVRKTRRRLLLHQYLLLALRVLVLALVALAAAEPYLERYPLQAAPGQRTHRVLVLDGSYSMAYGPTDQSRFERAKQVAAQIVEQSPQGDGFTLVLMGAPSRVVVGRAAFESGSFLQEIDQLPQTHAGADLLQTLALVRQLIESVGREHPRLGRHEVYFLTDLGRAGWAAEGDGASAGELQHRAAQLAQVARLVVIDLGQPKAVNAALVDLHAGQSLVTLSDRVQLTAQARQFGGAGPSRREIDLLLDGRRVGRQVVELEPGQQRAVRFTCRFESPGDHVLEARLQSDALELDNHRWLVLGVRASVAVLCVDGRPDGAGEGSTFFLRRALAPEGNEAGPIRVDVVPESVLSERDLSAYACVWLSNVAQFTPGEARLLARYLAGGGQLVFFLGDRVLADRYNRQLTASADSAPGQSTGVPILPATLGEVVDRAQGIDPLGYRHPAVRVFRGQEDTGLLTTPLQKYFRLHVPRDSAAQVVLGLTGGDPLVVEQPVGRGRVVLVATAADASWSQWPRWPSFLPFVHELLAWALGTGQQHHNVLVGQTLEGMRPASLSEPLRVTRPDGSRETLRPEAGQERWSYAETSASGVYSVGPASPAVLPELFAVNLDTAESDLARVEPDELRQKVWPGVAWQYETSWENPEQAAAHVARPAAGLPVWILYVALVLMLAETFGAWRQGEVRA